jgi:hypothetical protein
MNPLHYRNQLIALATIVAWQAIAPVNAQMPANGGAAGAFGGLQPGLGGLPLITDARTRSISAENPTGEKGKGGMAIPNPADPNLPHSAAAVDLGQGWKVRPFLTVKAGETVTLMDVAGPGVIQHIWLVAHQEGRGQSCVLRFYWDDEETPSVESPVTDFFAVGHGKVAPVNSLPVMVNAGNALNCFWPMPFRKHAKITFTNEAETDIGVLAYQITYAETPVPENAGYFHAQWRHANTATQNPYVILDGVKGQGQYVGTFLAWSQMSDGWFGEGEVKFYLDGDREFPTICGTGTEDYFLSSWGFSRVFSAPFVGVPLKDGCPEAEPNGRAGTKWSLYRWHVMDPVRFQQDLRVTVQALGWAPKYRKLSDDVSSVAYWYQTEPHAPFPKLPSLDERLKPGKAATTAIKGAIECEDLKVLGSTPGREVGRQNLNSFGSGWSAGSHLWFQAKAAGDFIEIEVPAGDRSKAKIILHATRAPDYGKLTFTVNNKPAGTEFDGYSANPAPSGPVDLGVHEARDGRFSIRIELSGTHPSSLDARYFAGFDAIVLEDP